jgi:hypothetical protein
MKKVIWVANESENWNHSHHYETLIEDLTGFNFKEDLCSETVKYMTKRLTDTPYQRQFRFKYTIFENEYKALVEKFKTQAENNAKIEVK